MPPLFAKAVKFAVVPEHIETSLTSIVMDGVTVAVTLIVTELDVAVVAVAHDALPVIMQSTTSPLASVLSLYEVELLPTLLPFFFHW